MAGMRAVDEAPLQVVSFRLADRGFGFLLTDVSEIIPIVAITQVPEAPPWMPGVIDLRGRTLPVIDLRTRLDLPAMEIDIHVAIIVAEPGPGEAVGFIVDRVPDIVTVPSDTVDPADNLGTGDHPVRAIARAADGVILILDVTRLARDPRALALPKALP